MNSRTTGSATSASSSAMRTSRSVSLTLSSVRRPRPLILRGVRDKRSVKLSNIVSRTGVETVGRRSGYSYRISPQYTMKYPSLFVMQRLELRSRNAILLLFLLLVNCRHNYARFCFTCPCRPLLLQPRADRFPDCCKKTAAGGVWLFFLRSSLVCHAVALESRILPGGDSGQNLSLLNVGSLVSLMITCTIDDHCRVA